MDMQSPEMYMPSPQSKGPGGTRGQQLWGTMQAETVTKSRQTTM